jgi:hypothetical protein
MIFKYKFDDIRNLYCVTCMHDFFEKDDLHA